MDEEALNYDPKTKTPMILAVGRLELHEKGYVYFDDSDIEVVHNSF